MRNRQKVGRQLVDGKGRVENARSNKFKFESYIESLSNIEINIGGDELWQFYSREGSVGEERQCSESIMESLEYDSHIRGFAEAESINEETEFEEESVIRKKLSNTAFAESLGHWEEKVRCLEFSELVRTLRPYRYSLVHVIDNLELIVKELTIRLNDCEHPETAEAISFLLGSLAKDTRLELLPFLSSIFESLSERLENQFTDKSITGQGGAGLYNAKVIQSVFSCTGTIFFYLSNYILKDLSYYLRVYRKWIYHVNSTIRHFSAESIAYAIKKGKNSCLIRSLDCLLSFSREEMHSCGDHYSGLRNQRFLSEWLSMVISNVVFSTNGFTTTKGDTVYRYLLRYVSFGLSIEGRLECLLEGFSGKSEASLLLSQNQGLISSYLNTMNHSDLVLNSDFTSICDAGFRDSFPELCALVQDILETLKLGILDESNVESFRKVLLYLLEIYLELVFDFIDLLGKIDGKDVTGDTKTKNINEDKTEMTKHTEKLKELISSLIKVLEMISRWICISIRKVGANEHETIGEIGIESKNSSFVYKRRQFCFEFSQITVRMLLVPMQDLENVIDIGLIHSLILKRDSETEGNIVLRLFSKYISMFVGIITSVTKESIALGKRDFVGTLASPNHGGVGEQEDLLLMDKFSLFRHLIAQYFEWSPEQNKQINVTKWRWLALLLDAFSGRNVCNMLTQDQAVKMDLVKDEKNHGFWMLIDILNSVSDIIPALLNSDVCGNKGLEDFMCIILKHQEALLVSRSHNGELLTENNREFCVSLIENLNLFLNRMGNTGLRYYFKNLEIRINILRLCCSSINMHGYSRIIDDCYYYEITGTIKLVSSLLNYQDVLVKNEETNWSIQQLSDYESLISEFKKNILSLYDHIFASKLDVSNMGKITSAFKSVNSIKTFKHFCRVFQRLRIINERVNLDLFLHNLEKWVNLSLLREERTMITHVPGVPIKYNEELISVLEILLLEPKGDKFLENRKDILGIPEIKDPQEENCLMSLFLYWISSPLWEVRKKSVILFSDYLRERKGSIMLRDIVCGVDLVKELESSETTLENERSKLRIIQRICDLIFCIVTKHEEFDNHYILRYLISDILSQFYVKLSLIWKPCAEMLVKLIKTVVNENKTESGRQRSLYLVEIIYSNIFHMIYVNSETTRTEDHFEEFESSDKIEKTHSEKECSSYYTDEITITEWSCRLLSDMLSVLNMDLLYLMDSESEFSFYYNLVLYWIIQMSNNMQNSSGLSLKNDYIVYTRTRKCCDESGTFLDQIPNIDLPFQTKGQIQRVNHLLKVLESVLKVTMNKRGNVDKNKPFVYLFDKFIQENVPGLLQINHSEMQLCLVRIICGNYETEGNSEDSFPSLRKYRQMFEVLISGSSKEDTCIKSKSFRNILLMFPLSMDREDIIKKEDRPNVIPIVIRILLSKLGKSKEGQDRSHGITRLSKKGNKALSSNNKRKVIMSYFSELPMAEISLLISVIVEPMVKVIIVHKNGDSSEIKGYLKSRFLDYMIKEDSPLTIKKHWIWKERLSETDGLSGFVNRNYEFPSDKLVNSNDNTMVKEVILALRPVDLLENEHKLLLRFLSYLDTLLDNMSHSLRDNMHFILAILVNVLQVDVIECLERSKTMTAPMLVSLKKRAKSVSRMLFVTIIKILLSYPKQSEEWLYFIEPVSPYIMKRFNSNMEHKKEQKNDLQMSSVMDLMVSFSKAESLFCFYEKLFPEAIREFSRFISSQRVLDGIKAYSQSRTQAKRAVGDAIGESNPEIVISKVVDMYLNIIFGGSERVLSFKGTVKRNMWIFQNSALNIELSLEVIDEKEEDVVVIDNRNNLVVFTLSLLGVKIIGRLVMEIIDSLRKVIHKRNSVKVSKRREIVTWNELILLRMFALLEMKGIYRRFLESNGDGKIVCSDSSLSSLVPAAKASSDSEENSKYNQNLSKIVLLLILSCMGKLNSKSEAVTNSNIGILDLILNLLKSFKQKTILETFKIDSGEDQSEHILDLEDRICSLLDKETTTEESHINPCQNDSYYYLSFYRLISEVMGKFLLKIEDLRLRGIISQIYLLSESILSGNDEIEDFENIAENERLAIPFLIYSLNNCQKGQKGSLDAEIDTNLQLDILSRLNTELLFKNITLVTSESKREEVCVMNVDSSGLYRMIYPIVNQLLYYISTNNNEEFSVINMSVKIIKRIIKSWCNEIRHVELKDQFICDDKRAGKECNKESESKIRSLYRLILNSIVPLCEEILRYSSYGLSKKRAILTLMDTLMCEFEPYLDYFSVKFGIPKDHLVDTFHLSLLPIRKYMTMEDNEETTLLEEIVHIQKHRRARALNFFGKFSRFSLNFFSGVKEKVGAGTASSFNDPFSSNNSNSESNHFLDKYELKYPLGSYTVKTIGISFCLYSLIQRESSRETYHLGLGDNSLRSLESFSMYLTWKECIELTGHLIRLLKQYPQRKTYLIKAMCSLLNSFDFQINNMVVFSASLGLKESHEEGSDKTLKFTVEEDDNNRIEEKLSEMQLSVKRKLLPLLRSVMVDTGTVAGSRSRKNSTGKEGEDPTTTRSQSDRNFGLIRSDIVLVIIRVLRCLPSKEFHSELPKLITQLILALKSREREVRRSSRSSLKSICKTLGTSYLVWIFKQMASILTRGYQLPVLIFTVHSILSEIFSVPTDMELVNNKMEERETAQRLDDCIEVVSGMIVEELNRIADPDRRTVSLDTLDTPIVGTVDEGKYIRSPHIMRILSKNVTLEGANRLFAFLYDLISGVKGDRDESSVMSDSYSQKYLYWLKTLYLQFCVGFLSNRNVSDSERLEFSINNLVRSIVIDKSMLRNEDLYKLIHSMDFRVRSLFQDPLNLLCSEGINRNNTFSCRNKEGDATTQSKRDRHYLIQPGASTGRGTHQVIRHQRGFERKVRSVVLCNFSLYLLNGVLKLVNNGNFDKIFGKEETERTEGSNVASTFNGDSGADYTNRETLEGTEITAPILETCLPFELLVRHMLRLVTLTFSDSSSELASISCKCLVRILIINSMESSKKYDFLEIDRLSPLISKISMNVMQKSGVSSVNTSNSNITELISSSMRLFVALLVRPKSVEWFNGLFFDKSNRKMTSYYTNVLKQLHITINDKRLRVTSLQLLRQIILFGKEHIRLSYESLESLYSLVDSVLPVIVQHSTFEPKIVSIGCNLYVEFLLHYPMSEKSQKQRVSILLENLPEYPTSEGREALLTAINELVSRFPIKLMKQSYNIMFLCGLTLALSVETETRPINMIKDIVCDILNMYRNDNGERIKLINTIFVTLDKIDISNKNYIEVKCGLVLLLRCVLEYFAKKKQVVCLTREIRGLGAILFSEIGDILGGIQQLTCGDTSNELAVLSLQRLEYETYNLLDLIVSDECLFDALNDEWILFNAKSLGVSHKEGEYVGLDGTRGYSAKSDAVDTWYRFWDLFILNSEGSGICFGLDSTHLWNKSAALRLITSTLRQSLSRKLRQVEDAGKKEVFVVSHILSERVFRGIFEKAIKLQFSPVLEESPWLIPKVMACTQHLILLSQSIGDDWRVPEKLSYLDNSDRADCNKSLLKIGTDGEKSGLGLQGRRGDSHYDKENLFNKKNVFGSTKRFKISKENEVREEDWLIYEDQEHSGEENEKGEYCDNESQDLEMMFDYADNNTSIRKMIKKQKKVLSGGDDDTEQVVDAYLLDHMVLNEQTGDSRDHGHNSRDQHSSESIRKEFHDKKGTIDIDSNIGDSSKAGLIVNTVASDIVPTASGISLIRPDIFFWFIDKVSCCCRYYTTKPGRYRARLIFGVKTLYDMVDLLPEILKSNGEDLDNIFKKDDPENGTVTRTIKHSIRALFQCSTMLSRTDLYDNLDQNITTSMNSFEWVNTVTYLDSHQVTKQACIFAQRAIEKWDNVFCNLNSSTVFMHCLSESRRQVLLNRFERKSKLKQDKIRNPEAAIKRKLSLRARNKRNKIKKLRIKIRNKKLGLK